MNFRLISSSTALSDLSYSLIFILATDLTLERSPLGILAASTRITSIILPGHHG